MFTICSCQQRHKRKRKIEFLIQYQQLTDDLVRLLPKAECLNTELFLTLREAQIVIENWRREFNTIRPHSALGYKPPAPQTIQPADPACAVWMLQPDRPSIGASLAVS